MGARADLTARATFSDGSAGLADAVWQSSDPMVASIDQRGNLRAHAEGETRITATFGPVRSEAALSVTPPTVALYDLTGRVVNQNGKPVADVLIVALDGASAGEETRTGWDGRFFLSELRGETTVAARKDGYAEQEQRSTGPPQELHFTLDGLAPRDSFGGGQWLVGDEIVARRYFGDPESGCVWQRRSGYSDIGGVDRAATSPPDPDFIAEGFFGFDALQAIVDIHDDDAIFRSTPECGVWGSEPSISRVQETIGPGNWLVGLQLLPGTYRAEAGEHCYWARVKSFGGTSEDIIEDDFLEAPGGVTVTLDDSDVGFYTDDECGPWTRVEAPP